MTQQSGADRSQVESASLSDILVYLGRRTQLNGTRVQKLLYLVEAEYADKHSRRLLNHPVFHDHFGMNSVVLENRVLAIANAESGPFNISGHKTDSGMGYSLTVREKIADPQLPKGIKEACDFVLENYGGIESTSKLAAAAKRTLPFFGTSQGAQVDWSSVTDPNLRGDCDHQLSEKGRKRLLVAMGEPEA